MFPIGLVDVPLPNSYANLNVTGMASLTVFLEVKFLTHKFSAVWSKRFQIRVDGTFLRILSMLLLLGLSQRINDELNQRSWLHIVNLALSGKVAFNKHEIAYIAVEQQQGLSVTTINVDRNISSNKPRHLIHSSFPLLTTNHNRSLYTS